MVEQKREINLVTLLGMIFGTAGFFAFPLIGAVLTLIFGYVGVSQIKREPDRYEPFWMSYAQWCIIGGWVEIFISLFILPLLGVIVMALGFALAAYAPPG